MPYIDTAAQKIRSGGQSQERRPSGVGELATKHVPSDSCNARKEKNQEQLDWWQDDNQTCRFRRPVLFGEPGDAFLNEVPLKAIDPGRWKVFDAELDGDGLSRFHFCRQVGAESLFERLSCRREPVVRSLESLRRQPGDESVVAQAHFYLALAIEKEESSTPTVGY